MKDLSSLLREVSRPFRPFPSVERQLVNLEEELRICQLPFDDKNVRERGRERPRGTGYMSNVSAGTVSFLCIRFSMRV